MIPNLKTELPKSQWTPQESHYVMMRIQREKTLQELFKIFSWKYLFLNNHLQHWHSKIIIRIARFLHHCKTIFHFPFQRQNSHFRPPAPASSSPPRLVSSVRCRRIRRTRFRREKGVCFIIIILILATVPPCTTEIRWTKGAERNLLLTLFPLFPLFLLFLLLLGWGCRFLGDGFGGRDRGSRRASTGTGNCRGERREREAVGDFAAGEKEIGRGFGGWDLAETGVVGGGGNEDGFMEDIGEITGTARGERGLEDTRETELETCVHWREREREKEKEKRERERERKRGGRRRRKKEKRAKWKWQRVVRNAWETKSGECLFK